MACSLVARRAGGRRARRCRRQARHATSERGGVRGGAARPPAVIAPEDVPHWMDVCGARNTDALLAELVKDAARTLAHPPISKFRVGAAALGKSGAIYLGANLEFNGAPLGQSVHAEQFTVALMAECGEMGLRSLALTHSPCGHCRQFFQEVYGASGMRIVFPGSPSAVLSDLLPSAFTPKDLHPDPPLVMRGDRFDVDPANRSETLDELAQAALEAARGCHAPYTGCPSGVAVRFADGAMFSGPYFECAAYNPSLPPMQAAVVSAVARGYSIPNGSENGNDDGRKHVPIVDAVLCERSDAKVSQRVITGIVLTSLTDGTVPLRVVPIV